MVSPCRILALLCFLSVIQSSPLDNQSPTLPGRQAPTNDRTTRDLRSLSDASFTRLENSAFPGYGVRIKKSHFCDGTVNAYTGYFDFRTRHLFFYFFESRSDPDKDDVIYWTNGGPGASSALGLLLEMGPCTITSQNETVYNPYSWNANANMFFVDQPVGVGFSYSDDGVLVDSSEQAAGDVATFIAIFFEHFVEFKGRALHMAGESQGGRYIPLFASQVSDQNAMLIQAGITPINLTSIMIGDGLTDITTLFESYYAMQCTSASTYPFQDIKTCVRMKQSLPRCVRWMKESCVDQFNFISCGAATTFCTDELSTPFYNTGKSAYDISKACQGEVQVTLCYYATLNIEAYLNKPEVRNFLGVDPSVTNFSIVAWNINTAFNNNLDSSRVTPPYVANLLERGVRVLIYVGTNDFICNWIGNEKWSLDMEWTGQKEYASQNLKHWSVDGSVVGKTRGANGLTFVTINGAGHMVAYDKPKEAQELVKRWLIGENI